MAIARPFMCVRSRAGKANRVVTPPCDVYNRRKALEAVRRSPLFFLSIDRVEAQLPGDVDIYDDRIYNKAKEILNGQIREGVYMTSPQGNHYLYESTMGSRSRTRVMVYRSTDGCLKGVIKKHENTREDKEIDRIRHMDTTSARTGPIFLVYRQDNTVRGIVEGTKEEQPIYNLVTENGIGYRVRITGDRGQIVAAERALERIPATYIAGGHHRAASATKVGLKRQEVDPGYTGEGPFSYLPTMLFPDEELMILPYNRMVENLNGMDRNGFLKAMVEWFEVRELDAKAFAPREKSVFGMFLGDSWCPLKVRPQGLSSGPVEGPDMPILQDQLLEPILGIGNPCTDKRVDFIGGTRGLGELGRRCHGDMKIAFFMYSTSINELLSVADAGLLIPPKSAWFESRLRSELPIRKLS